jgi:hypothetical protein
MAAAYVSAATDTCRYSLLRLLLSTLHRKYKEAHVVKTRASCTKRQKQSTLAAFGATLSTEMLRWRVGLLLVQEHVADAFTAARC